MNREKFISQWLRLYLIIGLLLAGCTAISIGLITAGVDLSLWITLSPVVGLSLIVFGTFHAFKLQERVIRQREERTASIVENTVDGIVVSNAQGIVLEVNRAAETIFGYNSEEVIGRNVSVLMANSDSRYHDQYIKGYTKGGGPKVMGKGRELEGLRKDGTTFPLSIALAEIQWGDEIGFTAIVRDITVVKKTEVALRESEERYRFFADNVDEGVIVTEQGKITDASSVLLKMLDCKLEDLIGRSPLDFTAPFQRDRVQKIIVSGNTESYESDLLRTDGTVFPARVTGRNLTFGDRNVRFTTVLDITKQKQNEAALRESEERYRFFVDNVDEGILVSEQGKIIDASSVWLDIIGCKLENALGRSPLEYIAPFRHDEVKKIIASGKQEAYESDILRADGTLFPALVRGRNLTFDGRSIRLITILDITKQKEDEAALRESEERYRFFADNVTEGIHVSIDGEITDASSVWLNMFGCKLEDAIGRSPLDYAAPFQHDRIRKIIASGSTETYDSDLLRTDGAVFPARVTGRNLTFGGRDVRFTTVLDITEQKEKEERYRFFIDNVSEGILVSVEGKITDASSVWLNMVGCKLEDALGKSPAEFMSPHERDRGRDIIASGSSEPYEVELVNSNGKTFLTLVKARVLTFGGRNVRFAAILDITKQKEDEAALIEAKEEADKANLAKSEFLSTMSHELRTPLNAILGFGQLLRRGSQGELNGHQIDHVDHILDGGNHLVQLINEILELSHIESGAMVLNIEDVSIADVLKKCQSLMSVIASENGINISIVGDALGNINAHVDYARFKQVLINLMSNAIKYNRQNGEVIISAEQITDNMLRLAISDTGYGIPDRKLHELFKPFSRLGAETSDIEGTGIGLVVCKDLIELMGGTIGVESKEDKGSTFWVEVPIANPSDASSVATSEPSAISEEAFPNVKGTLLYVEDTLTNIRLMESIVSQIEGLTIVTALTGEEGVKLAKITKPDIIILDINLPGMSGIEVLKELRRHDETRAIPALAMSAAATKRDIDKGLDAGFLQYLTKPIQVSEVVEAISAVMRASSGEESG